MKIYDILKWDPADEEGKEIVAYKHEAEDFNTHTQLIVHASQEAIFFKDGRDLDVFDAGRHTLSSDNLPLLGKLVNLATAGQTPFHCEVYFINKIYLNDLKWGTPEPISATDMVNNLTVHIRARGLFGAHITDGRKFLRKIVGTRAVYTREELAIELRAKLVEFVRDLLGKCFKERHLDTLELDSHTIELSNIIKEQLAPYFDEFGITLHNFSFMAISPLEEDLKELNEGRRNLKKAEFEGRAAATKMDYESEALARKRAREGYTYQQEHSFDVLKTAAGNEGMSGNMMGAGMGLGMGFGVGGAFGAGMNNMSQNLTTNSQPQPSAPATTPCPKCGSPVAAGAKFCANCGEKMVDPNTVICPSCNNPVPKGTKFCPECGTKLVNNCVNCGKELAPGAKFCPECGTPQK